METKNSANNRVNAFGMSTGRGAERDGAAGGASTFGVVWIKHLQVSHYLDVRDTAERCELGYICDTKMQDSVFLLYPSLRRKSN